MSVNLTKAEQNELKGLIISFGKQYQIFLDERNKPKRLLAFHNLMQKVM